MADHEMTYLQAATEVLPEEKRRYPRYAIDIAVKMKINSAAGVSTFCYGRGSNVSEGGMALFIAHELRVGQSVRLTLTLPYCDRPIECEVVVRNRDSFRYGVEFIRVTKFDCEMLNRTCKALSIVQ